MQRSTASAGSVSLVLHKFSRGGSDRVAAYLANGFRDAGMDVNLIVLCRGGETERLLSELVGDIRVNYLGRSTRWRGFDLARTFPALVRNLRVEAPNAVVSTANNTALVTALALKAARLKNTKLLLKTTNPIANSRHTGVVRKLRLASYRLIFRWTTAVWTLSADESSQMRREFPKFGKLFQDVRNPYVTDEMLVAAGPQVRSKTVVTVARLTRQKRVDRLIAAFAHIKDPGTRLLVLGEGEQRAELESQIAALGLSGRVGMPGHVADVAPALKQADLFVLTSDYEGLPAAILEAMAANCPVLCTDSFPSARSLIQNAEGCALIENIEPLALARQMEASLEQPRPTSLRETALDYSVENGVRCHVSALRECLNTED